MTVDPQVLRNMADALKGDGYRVYPDVLRDAADEMERQQIVWLRHRVLMFRATTSTDNGVWSEKGGA